MEDKPYWREKAAQSHCCSKTDWILLLLKQQPARCSFKTLYYLNTRMHFMNPAPRWLAFTAAATFGNLKTKQRKGKWGEREAVNVMKRQNKRLFGEAETASNVRSAGSCCPLVPNAPSVPTTQYDTAETRMNYS